MPAAATGPAIVAGFSGGALAELLGASAQRFCTPQQVERFTRSQAAGVVSSAELAKFFRVSRVAVRDSVMKARAKALAGVVFKACESQDPELAEVLLSTEFSRQAAFNADVMRAFEGLVSELPTENRDRIFQGSVWLWERSARYICDVLSRASEYKPEELIITQPASMILFLAARCFGHELSSVFCETWKSACGQGLRDHPHFLRHLATVGSYCGIQEHQLDFFRSFTEAGSIELAGTAVFAAGDLRSGLPIGELMAGRPGGVLKALRNKPKLYNPFLDHTIAAVGNPRYNNEALLEMVLRWVLNLCSESQSHGFQLDKGRRRSLRHSLCQYRHRLCVWQRTRELHDQVMRCLDDAGS